MDTFIHLNNVGCLSSGIFFFKQREFVKVLKINNMTNPKKKYKKYNAQSTSYYAQGATYLLAYQN